MSRPLGANVMAHLHELARCTSEPGRLTRLYLTPAHAAGIGMVKGWMEEAGMTVENDAAANVVGRYAGARPGLPTLLLGSHIDTVRDAGHYDGNLGVIAAIEAVAALHAAGERAAQGRPGRRGRDDPGGRAPRRRCTEPALVATVGAAEASPGAPNVVPGRATFALDIRAPVDADRLKAIEDLVAAFATLAARRHVRVRVEKFYDEPAVACDPSLVAALEAAVQRAGVTPHRLPSGAGHDGLAIAAL